MNVHSLGSAQNMARGARERRRLAFRKGDYRVAQIREKRVAPHKKTQRTPLHEWEAQSHWRDIFSGSDQAQAHSEGASPKAN
jgi:hypothetical protein